MKKSVREGWETRSMEKTVLAAQTAKTRPRTHNAFTIKASETEIEGDASTVEAFGAVVFSRLFRRSIEEDLRNLKFWIKLKQEKWRSKPRLLMGLAQSQNDTDMTKTNSSSTPHTLFLHPHIIFLFHNRPSWNYINTPILIKPLSFPIGWPSYSV